MAIKQLPKIKLPKINIAALQRVLLGQFRGLDTRDPASWPVVPRGALCLALMAGIVAVLWFTWLNGSDAELEAEQK